MAKAPKMLVSDLTAKQIKEIAMGLARDDPKARRAVEAFFGEEVVGSLLFEQAAAASAVASALDATIAAVNNTSETKVLDGYEARIFVLEQGVYETSPYLKKGLKRLTVFVKPSSNHVNMGVSSDSEGGKTGRSLNVFDLLDTGRKALPPRRQKDSNRWRGYPMYNIAADVTKNDRLKKSRDAKGRFQGATARPLQSQNIRKVAGAMQQDDIRTKADRKVYEALKAQLTRGVTRPEPRKFSTTQTPVVFAKSVKAQPGRGVYKKALATAKRRVGKIGGWDAVMGGSVRGTELDDTTLYKLYTRERTFRAEQAGELLGFLKAITKAGM